MKKPTFGGKNRLRSGRPPKPLVRRASECIPVSEESSEENAPELKDVWCVCTIYTDRGATRDGMLLGISDTHARIRFPNRSLLSGSLRVKASRIGLNRSARVASQDEFDVILEFDKDA
jgi:hypothetical protein